MKFSEVKPSAHNKKKKKNNIEKLFKIVNSHMKL